MANQFSVGDKVLYKGLPYIVESYVGSKVLTIKNENSRSLYVYESECKLLRKSQE